MNGTSIPPLGAEAGCSLARTGSVLTSALASAGSGGLSIRIAIAPDFTRTAALFGGGEALLDHFAGNCTRHALAVDEEHGRRAGDIFLLAERERLVDRRGVAGAGGGRCNIVDELIVPRLDLVF